MRKPLGQNKVLNNVEMAKILAEWQREAQVGFIRRL
jgi:hypothetical protein